MIARTLTVFLLCLGFSVQSAAPAKSEKNRAVDMVKAAAELVGKVGPEKALLEIGRADGPFVEGELYVFAYDMSGVIVAHPRNAKLVGKNMLDVPDVDGKLFRKEIIEVARTKGTGWVDYKYKNAETGKVEEKTTWVRKVGNLVLCCGVYR